MTRGRKPLVDPPASLHLMLPLTLRTRLDLHLFSEVEGRVPKGAYQAFLAPLIAQAFEDRRLDLSPYLSSLPGDHVVRGSHTTIEALERLLQEAQDVLP